jgi:hypothetical protein
MSKIWTVFKLPGLNKTQIICNLLNSYSNGTHFPNFIHSWYPLCRHLNGLQLCIKCPCTMTLTCSNFQRLLVHVLQNQRIETQRKVYVSSKQLPQTSQIIQEVVIFAWQENIKYHGQLRTVTGETLLPSMDQYYLPHFNIYYITRKML